MPLAERRALQDSANPCYIPRNALMQDAIKAAEAGSFEEVRVPPSVIQGEKGGGRGPKQEVCKSCSRTWQGKIHCIQGGTDVLKNVGFGDGGKSGMTRVYLTCVQRKAISGRRSCGASSTWPRRAA